MRDKKSKLCNDKLKSGLIKTRRNIKQKFKKLHNERLKKEYDLEKKCKPITESIGKLISNNKANRAPANQPKSNDTTNDESHIYDSVHDAADSDSNSTWDGSQDDYEMFEDDGTQLYGNRRDGPNDRKGSGNNEVTHTQHEISDEEHYESSQVSDDDDSINPNDVEFRELERYQRPEQKRLYEEDDLDQVSKAKSRRVSRKRLESSETREKLYTIKAMRRVIPQPSPIREISPLPYVRPQTVPHSEQKRQYRKYDLDDVQTAKKDKKSLMRLELREIRKKFDDIKALRRKVPLPSPIREKRPTPNVESFFPGSRSELHEEHVVRDEKKTKKKLKKEPGPSNVIITRATTRRLSQEAPEIFIISDSSDEDEDTNFKRRIIDLNDQKRSRKPPKKNNNRITSSLERRMNILKPKNKSKTGGNIDSRFISYNNRIDYIYFDDPNELCDRLKLLISSKASGNTNHQREINSIIEELRENDIIA